MSGRFEFAGTLFRESASAEDRRRAAQVWLTDAIQVANSDGDDVGPAIALLGALEALDFGTVDPMFKLSEAQKRGGKEPPPAEAGLDAMAIAAVGRLLELGEKNALKQVSSVLGKKIGSLRSKRKHVLAERAKPDAERTQYRGLIADFEGERLRMATQSRDDIISGLSRVVKLLGQR